MKMLGLILCFVALTFNSLAVSIVLPNGGPVTVKLMAMAQGLDNAIVSGKTNNTATETIVKTIAKSTASNSVIDSAGILSLIENSFDTALPSGAQLVVSRTGPFFGLYVADSTGSNVVLNLSTNVFLGAVANEQPVHVGIQTTTTEASTNVIIIQTTVETVTQTAVFGYDDTGLATKDGSHTKFNITLLVTRKTSELGIGPWGTKDTIKFEGIGSGTVRDQNVILQASGSAAITGVVSAP